MEQFELELIADELEKVLDQKKDLDRAREMIYKKFINSVRDQKDMEIYEFLNDFEG